MKPSKTQFKPVKPLQAEWNLVRPSKNPMKPSKTQWNPVKPSETQ